MDEAQGRVNLLQGRLWAPLFIKTAFKVAVRKPTQLSRIHRPKERKELESDQSKGACQYSVSIAATADAYSGPAASCLSDGRLGTAEDCIRDI